MAKSCNLPLCPLLLVLVLLLLAPHVQVLEWAQRILAAGEAFSGVECSSLRSMLTAQSSNFFNAYHSSNLEALHSMLEKELWRRLPSFGEGIIMIMIMIMIMMMIMIMIMIWMVITITITITITVTITMTITVTITTTITTIIVIIITIIIRLWRRFRPVLEKV